MPGWQVDPSTWQSFMRGEHPRKDTGLVPLARDGRRGKECCPQCQLTSSHRSPPVHLLLLPIINVPFERIGMDLKGPLPKCARGHEYILTIVCYANQYPEALPLRKAISRSIARKLVLLFSCVGIPRELLTDQGTPLISKLIKDLAHSYRSTTSVPQFITLRQMAWWNSTTRP